MIDEVESGNGPETAFRRSGEMEFVGQPLQPFSFVRQTAALELGLRFWRLTPDDIYSLPNPNLERKRELKARLDGIVLRDTDGHPVAVAHFEEGNVEALREEYDKLAEEPEEVQMYDGLVMDTAIVLWLCSQSDATCRRARRKPKDYEAEIDRWADANGVAVGGKNFGEASALFMQLVNDVNSTKVEPVRAGGSSSGEAKN